MQMIKHLLNLHPKKRKYGMLQEHLDSYYKLRYDQKLEKLPWIYLHISKDILDNASSQAIDREYIDDDIRSTFPELQQLALFKIVFFPSQIQEVLLCRMLLKDAMDRSLGVLGHFQDEFLKSVYHELNKPLDYIDENQDVHRQRKRLIDISQDIFYRLKDSLGENAVLNVYHGTYKRHFGNYYLLDAFTATLNIVPDEILNQEMVDLPSKRQMHKMLQQQVSSLETINSRLTTEVVERKKTQKNLEKSEELKTSILKNAMDGIVLFDQDYVIKDVNKQCEKIFDWQTQKVLNTSLLRHGSQEFRQLIKKIVEGAKKQDINSLETERHEIITTKETGEEIDLEISVTIVHHEDEILFNAFLRDITEKKISERELKEAKDIAEKSAKAKTVFLSNMSHEIRTPLNVILGLSEMLMTGNSSKKDERKNVESIHFSAENLLVLVNDILDFSAIDAGKITLAKTPFDLYKSLENVKNGFVPKAKDKGIELGFSIESSIPQMIIGDILRLHQILGNLISNAIKFTEKGTVTVSLKAKELTQQQITILFSVKDTGIGISEQHIENIFNSFYQVNSPDIKKSEGTGLGLSITRQLIELHGSNLEVDSIEGLGTEFKFELNFELAGFQVVEDYDKTMEKLEKSLHGFKVLLAEDNKLNQFYIKQLLSKWKLDITIAENGAEALDLFKKNTYDIILMDQHMPKMNGYECTRLIRNINMNIPIIACSADVFNESRKSAFEAGVNFYITKPIQTEEIRQILISCVNNIRVSDIQATSNHKVKNSLPQNYGGDSINLDLSHLKNTIGDEEFIVTILEVFVEETPDDLRILKEQINTADFENAGLTAHKIKSSYRTLGMTKISGLLQKIELAAKNEEKIDKIKNKWLPELIPMLDSSMEEVKDYLKNK